MYSRHCVDFAQFDTKLVYNFASKNSPCVLWQPQWTASLSSCLFGSEQTVSQSMFETLADHTARIIGNIQIATFNNIFNLILKLNIQLINVKTMKAWINVQISSWNYGRNNVCRLIICNYNIQHVVLSIKIFRNIRCSVWTIVTFYFVVTLDARWYDGERDDTMKTRWYDCKIAITGWNIAISPSYHRVLTIVFSPSYNCVFTVVHRG